MPRSAFWRWRHARPFWGGLLVLLAGIWIFLTEKAPLPVIVHVGMQGFIGYLVPIVLALCGVLLIVNPAQRLFYSLLAAVLSLASWLTSNLGGFILGLLLGLIGSALAFAWSPDKHRARPDLLSTPVSTGPAEPTDAVPSAAGPPAARPTAGEPPATGRPSATEPSAAGRDATAPSPAAATVGEPPATGRPSATEPSAAGPDAIAPSPAAATVGEPAGVPAGEPVTVPANGQPKDLGPPGVQPDTSHRRPRHRRPSPGSDSVE